jgi:hypothetical protein
MNSMPPIPPTVISCETLVYSDPGADIDDEVAIEWILKQGHDIVLCIGGTGTLERWTHYAQDKIYSGTVTIAFDNGKIPENVILKPRIMIVIAPQVDSLLPHLDLSELTSVSFQGNQVKCHPEVFVGKDWVDQTEAFNDKGSQKFFTALPAKCRGQQLTVRVVTSAECNQEHNLFSNRLFKELELSAESIAKVQQSVWKNLIGRMHPSHVANHVAEGLINPDIKGANYLLAERIFSASRLSTTPKPSPELRDAVSLYINALAMDGKIKSDKSQAYLLDMCKWIAAIIGRDPLDADKFLITSSTSEPLHIAYPEAFKRFCSIGIYSPAYDLATVQATFFTLS